MEVDASSFVGCFVRLSLIRDGVIGLPRSELFIYADDIIYVLETRRAGLKHYFVPQLRFVHDCETLLEQKQVYNPLWKAYYTFRNGLELYRVASGAWFPLVVMIKIPLILLTVRFYDKTQRQRFLSIASTAIYDGLRRDYSKTHDAVVALGRNNG